MTGGWWGGNDILLITITSVVPSLMLDTHNILQKSYIINVWLSSAEAVGMLKFKILVKFYNLFKISLSSPKFLAIFCPGALQGECI